MNKEKIKTIAIGILALVVILLIVFKLQVNVSMQQTQNQSMKTDIWNNLNNQNINLNILYNLSTEKDLWYTNRVAESMEGVRMIMQTLSPFQIMFSHGFAIDKKVMVYYPVIGKQELSQKISTTNTSTNYQISSKTNLRWWNWK